MASQLKTHEQVPAPIHPMCQNAEDKEKCETFVERLDQAKDNIDPREH